MILFLDTFETPAGEFTAAIDEDGALVATAFGDEASLRARLTPAWHGAELQSAPDRLRPVRREIEAYFARRLREFTLPMVSQGSLFQQRVWKALRAVPFGETRSYGDLARALKTSARAVGRANATNPICLVVPCHRVIGSDGSLTGFAFGEKVKLSLLKHEGAKSEP